MTGWRLGWAQSSASMIRLMYKAAEFMSSNAAAMIQQAGIVALRDGEPYIRELQKQYAERRALITHGLAGISGISLPDAGGAFYVFPRIEGLTNSAEFAERLVRETGLALAPGSAFGAGGEGDVRICYAVSEPIVREAVRRLGEFMAR
jgi:aspartate/methionine/tyrosine aminotransferase